MTPALGTGMPKVVDPPPQWPGDPIRDNDHEHPTPSPAEIPGEPSPPHPSPDPKEVTKEPRAPHPGEPKTRPPERRLARRRRINMGARAMR
jgi:hypothetical protein